MGCGAGVDRQHAAGGNGTDKSLALDGLKQPAAPEKQASGKKVSFEEPKEEPEAEKAAATAVQPDAPSHEASCGQVAEASSSSALSSSRGTLAYMTKSPAPPLKKSEGGLTVATWNISAINNNPFEYYMTHDDNLYSTLMEEYEAFVEQPGDRDVQVCDVLSDALFEELAAHMEKEGWNVAPVRDRWNNEYRERKIITGFMKDKELGGKRLISMPDRVTNTIRLADDGVACRPTVINNYTGKMGSIVEWWPQWCDFMFSRELEVEGKVRDSLKKVRPCELLGAISRAKYPTISEEEEQCSLPLQCLCLAIFDAVVVHMLTTLSPDGRWQEIKETIVNSMFLNKDEHTLEVLRTAYAEIDVICLQEGASGFLKLLEKDLDEYHVVHPANYDPRRNQNSIVLLRRETFPSGLTAEVTAEAMAELGDVKGVDKGDLVALTAVDAKGRSFLIASFHGDTNGLATKPVVSAVAAVLGRQTPGCRLIVGLDANAYYEAKQGFLAVDDFLSHCGSLGIRSCWAQGCGKEMTSTCHARTFMQPQLNKAIRRAEKLTKGDQNPKDHVLINVSSSFDVLAIMRDNTGERRYVEDVCFPTLHFPSDHAVISVSLAEGGAAADG